MESTDKVDMPAIEFRDVSITFDNRPVLQNISFRLEQGEMILLTGVSGSGKSVLLQLAMGLMRPDAGQIFVDGYETEKLDETELLNIRGRLMGMVFQEESLFTGINVYENVAYRLQEHGWDEEATRTAVLEVLRFVDLSGEEEKYPDELSGGMKRRVELARALVGWPRIMLFDETTQSLDPLVAAQILDLVIRARDIQKISSLYVTKKMHELPYLGSYRAVTRDDGTIAIEEAPANALPPTRVVVLDQARIAFVGSVSEFETSSVPAVRNLNVLSDGEDLRGFQPADPWDKRRKPSENIL
jgi:phospholipid/cholesterol/gamma-HCH transport system ATP-binding protein